MINKNEIDIIFFHNPCQDGFGSAWIANLYGIDNKLDYKFCPISVGTVNFNDNFNDTKDIKDISELKSKKVLFVDYAPSDEQIKILNNNSIEFLILDHHKTNEDRLKNCDNVIFDMNKSGVGITWDYFYSSVEMPLFLQMIQDRDLWKWEVKDSKSFCDGLFIYSSLTKSINEKFELFNEVYRNESKFKEILFLGNILEEKKNKNIEDIAYHTTKKTYTYDNYKVYIVNCSHELTSDLGNYIVSNYDYDFAVCWRYDHEKEEYFCSLRSKDKIDVSIICKKYGGGGHKNAAGCSSKIHPSILFNTSQTI